MASHITIGLRLRSGLQAIRATMTKSSFLPVFLNTDGDKKNSIRVIRKEPSTYGEKYPRP